MVDRPPLTLSLNPSLLACHLKLCKKVKMRGTPTENVASQLRTQNQRFAYLSNSLDLALQVQFWDSTNVLHSMIFNLHCTLHPSQLKLPETP